MFPYETGNLIRCDCGHAASEHTAEGCAGGPGDCRCTKTATVIVLDEISALRPGWLAGAKTPLARA
jgi:hypothetical protein